MSAETFNILVNVVFGICSIAVPIAYKVLASQIRDIKDAIAHSNAPTLALATEAKAIALEFARNLNDFKLHVSQNYPPNNRFEQLERAIMDKLDRIEDKLDGKQDKP